VAILTNDGTGAFQQVQSVTVGVGPSAIVSARLVGDGLLDLAVTNECDGTVSILRNDAGSFSGDSTVGVGAGPTSIASADLDGDIDADLAVTNGLDGTVTILANEGGVFSAGDPIPVGNGPAAIVAEPLDANRSVDLAVANSADGEVVVLLNDGGAMFAIGPTITLPGGTGVTVLDPADLDHDKDTDLLALDGFGTTVSVILGSGDGSFAPAVQLPVDGPPRSSDALDVDLDGDSDIAVIVDDPDLGLVVRILRNDLFGGQLAFVLTDDVFGQGEDPLIVLAGDVDGDAIEDIVTVNGDGAGGGPAPLGPGDATVSSRLNLSDCDADLDENGVVDFQDLLRLIVAWGPCPGCPEDIDGSGAVDFQDLLLLLDAWGPCR
jgi:hypothetical protein